MKNSSKLFINVSDGIPGVKFRQQKSGIYKLRDKRNPFSEYDFQNISAVCDKDTVISTLSKTGTPESVLIYCGGGFNAAVFTLETLPLLCEIWRNCPNITVYIEGAYAGRNGGSLTGSFLSARENTPESVIFLQSSSIYDEEISAAMYRQKHNGRLNKTESAARFYVNLLETIRRQKAEIPGFSFFLTDYGGFRDSLTPHICSGKPKLFYSALENGVSIADWLKKATEGTPFDVGKRFI